MIRAAAMLALCAAAAAADPMEVVVLGDAPNGPPEEVRAPYAALLGAIEAADPALVVHVGDLNSGRTPCTDAWFAEQRAALDGLPLPVLLTPGDNDWTDCHSERMGGFDPAERLAHIRETFFDVPGRSLGGAPVDVAHQGAEGYPENARAQVGPLTVATVHVVGSNNGFEPRGPEAPMESMARSEAGVRWLREAFAAAEAAGSAGMVVAIHGDPFAVGFAPPWNAEIWLGHSGFAAFGAALRREARDYGRPVLLVHGDGHVFRQSRPFPSGAPNLTALQVPGEGEMHAVRVGVDPDAPGLFSIALLENPALAD